MPVAVLEAHADHLEGHMELGYRQKLHAALAPRIAELGEKPVRVQRQRPIQRLQRRIDGRHLVLQPRLIGGGDVLPRCRAGPGALVGQQDVHVVLLLQPVGVGAQRPHILRQRLPGQLTPVRPGDALVHRQEGRRLRGLAARGKGHPRRIQHHQPQRILRRIIQHTQQLLHRRQPADSGQMPCHARLRQHRGHLAPLQRLSQPEQRLALPVGGQGILRPAHHPDAVRLAAEHRRRCLPAAAVRRVVADGVAPAVLVIGHLAQPPLHEPQHIRSFLHHQARTAVQLHQRHAQFLAERRHPAPQQQQIRRRMNTLQRNEPQLLIQRHALHVAGDRVLPVQRRVLQIVVARTVVGQPAALRLRHKVPHILQLRIEEPEDGARLVPALQNHLSVRKHLLHQRPLARKRPRQRHLIPPHIQSAQVRLPRSIIPLAQQRAAVDGSHRRIPVAQLTRRRRHRAPPLKVYLTPRRHRHQHRRGQRQRRISQPFSHVRPP